MGNIRYLLLGGIGAALLSPVFAWAAAPPIVLTPGSYNQDGVVEAGAVDDPTTHFSNFITATMDGGTAKNGGVWYQQGLNSAAPTTGLPVGVAVSASDATTSFVLRPYTGNNVRLLDGANASGTLTLAAPAAYSKLSFLTASGNGTGTLSLIVHFADAFANLTGLAVTAPDWFNNTPIAVNSNGRVTASSGAYDNVNAGNPRLYQEDVTIGGEAANHPISSIDVSFSGSGGDTHTMVFAVSGTPTPEPGCIGLLAVGAAGLLGRRRR